MEIKEYTAAELKYPQEYGDDDEMIMFKMRDHLFSFWKGMPEFLDPEQHVYSPSIK